MVEESIPAPKNYKPEIVFGLVAPVGADLDAFLHLLKDFAWKFRYQLHHVRLSNAFSDSILQERFGFTIHKSTFASRLNT